MSKPTTKRHKMGAASRSLRSMSKKRGKAPQHQKMRKDRDQWKYGQE